MKSEEWSIECDYMESCNCDFGCACNFSGFPNNGRCEALVGYHIRKGNYGAVDLSGLDFIYAASSASMSRRAGICAFCQNTR